MGGLKSVKFFYELANLRFGFILRDAVSRLNHADQLVALAGDFGQFVVGDLAPHLSGFAAHLLPIAFYLIPVHSCVPLVVPPGC